MDIKIGEYVRTKDGIIDIVILPYKGKCANLNCNDKHISCKANYYIEDEIVKHSKNIIDLIEEDDFVNGCKVYENHKTYLTVYQKVKKSEVDYNYINYDEIKTILTHEQYEQNCYRLEEK